MAFYSQLFLPPDEASSAGALSLVGRVRLRLLSRPLPPSMAAAPEGLSARRAGLIRDLSIEAAATVSTLADLQILTGSLVMLGGLGDQSLKPARVYALIHDDSEPGAPEQGVLYCSPILLHNLRRLVRASHVAPAARLGDRAA